MRDVFLIEAVERNIEYYVSDLENLLKSIVNKALSKGKAKSREAVEQPIAWALTFINQWGGGCP